MEIKLSRASEEGREKSEGSDVAFSSLRLSLTLADFDEYLTNSHTFNKLWSGILTLLKDGKFIGHSQIDGANEQVNAISQIVRGYLSLGGSG